VHNPPSPANHYLRDLYVQGVRPDPTATSPRSHRPLQWLTTGSRCATALADAVLERAQVIRSFETGESCSRRRADYRALFSHLDRISSHNNRLICNSWYCTTRHDANSCHVHLAHSATTTSCLAAATPHARAAQRCGPPRCQVVIACAQRAILSSPTEPHE
jgi:hypothetical protein